MSTGPSNGLLRHCDVSGLRSLLPVSEKITAKGLARNYGVHRVGQGANRVLGASSVNYTQMWKRSLAAT
jgi:hypothetical protein